MICSIYFKVCFTLVLFLNLIEAHPLNGDKENEDESEDQDQDDRDGKDSLDFSILEVEQPDYIIEDIEVQNGDQPNSIDEQEGVVRIVDFDKNIEASSEKPFPDRPREVFFSKDPKPSESKVYLDDVLFEDEASRLKVVNLTLKSNGKTSGILINPSPGDFGNGPLVEEFAIESGFESSTKTSNRQLGKRNILVDTKTTVVSKVLVTVTNVLTTWSTCFATETSMPLCQSTAVNPLNPYSGKRKRRFINDAPISHEHSEVQPIVVSQYSWNNCYYSDYTETVLIHSLKFYLFGKQLHLQYFNEIHLQATSYNADYRSSGFLDTSDVQMLSPTSTTLTPRALFTLERRMTFPLTTTEITTVTAREFQTLRFNNNPHYPGCLPLNFLKENSVLPCQH